MRCRTDPTAGDTHNAFMLERPNKFVHLSVEGFRKLTIVQKQEYVAVLKHHLGLADSPQSSDLQFAPRAPAQPLERSPD